MKALILKTPLLTVALFATLLLTVGCSQSSTESNNTNATSTAGSQTSTGDLIADKISMIRYKAGAANNEELIKYKASYPEADNKCVIQIVNTYQYVDNSDVQSKHTKIFNLKDLDPTSLKVSPPTKKTTYSLFATTKNFRKVIRHTHITINKKVVAENEESLSIHSDNESLLKEIKAALLKKIRECNCGKGDFMKAAETSFVNITSKINDLNYTSSGMQSKKIKGSYKVSNPQPDNKCLMEVIGNTWYANESDTSKTTSILRIKNLDLSKLKVKYSDIMETYSLSLHTKNGQGKIKQKLPTKDGGFTSLNTSLLLIYSDERAVLETLEEDFLKAIKGCECGN